MERAVISFPNDLISNQFKFFDLTASLVRVRFFSIMTKYKNIFYLLFEKYKMAEKLNNK
jgi:hypothetical protein